MMNKSELKERIYAMRRNEIRYSFEEAEAELPVGSTKLGGRPSVPGGFEWPCFRGQDMDGVTADRPLSFLMQIDLEDARVFDSEGLLPESGTLLFFYECASMCWGFDPAHEGSSRVFYYEKGTALEAMDLPDDLAPEYRIPERRLIMETHLSLPDMDDFPDENKEADVDDYFDIMDEAECGVDSVGSGYSGKLLGYPSQIQGYLFFNREAVASGIYMGDTLEGRVTEEEQAEIAKRSKDWILLNEMGTLPAGDGEDEIMWGDDGLIYFTIKKEDLKAKVFDRAWLELQCY